MSFDLVIFDYDGVIADSELLNNRLMAELLTEVGLPTSLDEALALYMGKRWLDCQPLIEARLGRPCPGHVLPEWTRRCHTRATTELTAVAGAVDFMKGRSERRCIASSSPPDWIALGLSRFGLDDDDAGPVFSAAIHVTRGKPHPDLFLHAAATMDADPARTVVIEDSPYGVQAGVAAGMTVIGLCAGGHVRAGHAETLKAAGAHHLAHDYAEAARILDV